MAFPYKQWIEQQITDFDYPNKIFSCNVVWWARRWVRVSQEMVFSDECRFLLSKIVNEQDCQIWHSERLQRVLQSIQDHPSISICCALSQSGINGPFIFINHIEKGERYINMLRFYKFPRPQEHTGAISHYAAEVRQYLDQTLWNCWMGSAYPILLASSVTRKALPLLFMRISKRYRVWPPWSITRSRGKHYDPIPHIAENSSKNVYRNMGNRFHVLLREKLGHSKQQLNSNNYGYFKNCY